jgi:predicted transcriptional regulator
MKGEIDYESTKLGRYLLDIRQTGLQFSVHAKVSHPTIYSGLKGKNLRKDVVRKICKTSRGALTMQDFGFDIPVIEPSEVLVDK